MAKNSLPNLIKNSLIDQFENAFEVIKNLSHYSFFISHVQIVCIQNVIEFGYSGKCRMFVIKNATFSTNLKIVLR